MDVGIVGGGWISQSIVEAVGNHGDSVVGLCDTEPSRRAYWAERGLDTYSSMSDLIDVTQPAVLFILTPTHTHAALTLEALHAGIDVVVEKPFAASDEEARTILDAAERLGRRVLVEESYPWMPSHLAAAAAIAAGRVGRVTTILHTFYGWRARPERAAAVEAANSGGWRSEGGYPWLVDHVVHLFALSKRLSGWDSVTDVRSVGGPAEVAIAGATWRCGSVNVVWLRATRGAEEPLGVALGLHTRVIGTDGYLDVLGEGGAWGDEGPREGLRFSDGTCQAVSDLPDKLWVSDVGYYPSAHYGAVGAALDFLAGNGSRPYTANDATDDIVATQTLIESAQTVSTAFGGW